MNVGELIKELQKFPLDASVGYQTYPFADKMSPILYVKNSFGPTWFADKELTIPAVYVQIF